MDPLGVDSAAAGTPALDWRARVWQRIRYRTLLKTVGTTAFMVIFFRAYFALLENPRQAPTVLPEIWLDHWVDFTPAAFPIYLSLWVYVSLAPALMGNLRALLWFGTWVGVLCLLCLGVFWAWPTQTPPFGVDWGLYPGLSLIKGTDAAGNALSLAPRCLGRVQRLLAAPHPAPAAVPVGGPSGCRRRNAWPSSGRPWRRSSTWRWT